MARDSLHLKQALEIFLSFSRHLLGKHADHNTAHYAFGCKMFALCTSFFVFSVTMGQRFDLESPTSQCRTLNPEIQLAYIGHCCPHLTIVIFRLSMYTIRNY